MKAIRNPAVYLLLLLFVAIAVPSCARDGVYGYNRTFLVPDQALEEPPAADPFYKGTGSR